MPSAIDLTADSSDDRHAHKRLQREKQPALQRKGSDVWLLHDTADSAVAKAEAADRRKRTRSGSRDTKSRDSSGAVKCQKTGGEARGDGEDDIVVTAEHGQVATRDLAHSRPDCAVHRFTFGIVSTNKQHCAQCYCYVCDVKASECEFWGTGSRPEDHANARPLKEWNQLRRAMRAGDKAQVRASFAGKGSSAGQQQGQPPRPPGQKAHATYEAGRGGVHEKQLQDALRVLSAVDARIQAMVKALARR